MKIFQLKYTCWLWMLCTLVFVACNDDTFEDVEVVAPSNLQLQVSNDADELGLVHVRPSAEGVSYFEIEYGDATDPVWERIEVGGQGSHSYTEGTWTITARAYNVMGQSTEASRMINVMFDPPSDLMVDISIDPVNTNVVTVTPTATNAMTYEIYFGELTDEEATIITDGSANYTYSEAGMYDIRVVARSGSVTTVEYTETIEIVLPEVQLTLPIDFENPDIDYVFTSFGSASVELIDNPDMNGNSSQRVAQLTKPNGAEPWAGSFLQLPQPIDFSTETTMSVDVWSPKAGATVLLKLENDVDGTIFSEVMNTTTVSNTWETLSFDFSAIDQSQTYHKVVIFMDFGTPGDDSIYYFDNIRLGSGGTGGSEDKIEFPIDFESEELMYTFTSFGSAEADVIDNPDPTGNNTSSRVAHIFKPTGAMVWAGTFIDLSDAIDLSQGTTFTFNSWSPKVDAQILVKIEDSSDNTIFVELPTTTTVAGAWETLSIDFSGLDPTQSYERIVIFYDFGVEGQDEDYYFDDIRME